MRYKGLFFCLKYDPTPLARFPYSVLLQAETLIIYSRLGYAEMRVVLARMIWNFDLELGADKENINYTDNRRAWIMYEDKALMVKVTPRVMAP